MQWLIEKIAFVLHDLSCECLHLSFMFITAVLPRFSFLLAISQQRALLASLSATNVGYCKHFYGFVILIVQLMIKGRLV